MTLLLSFNMYQFHKILKILSTQNICNVGARILSNKDNWKAKINENDTYIKI